MSSTRDFLKLLYKQILAPHQGFAVAAIVSEIAFALVLWFGLHSWFPVLWVVSVAWLVHAFLGKTISGLFDRRPCPLCGTVHHTGDEPATAARIALTEAGLGTSVSPNHLSVVIFMSLDPKLVPERMSGYEGWKSSSGYYCLLVPTHLLTDEEWMTEEERYLLSVREVIRAGISVGSPYVSVRSEEGTATFALTCAQSENLFFALLNNGEMLPKPLILDVVRASIKVKGSAPQGEIIRVFLFVAYLLISHFVSILTRSFLWIYLIYIPVFVAVSWTLSTLFPSKLRPSKTPLLLEARVSHRSGDEEEG